MTIILENTLGEPTTIAVNNVDQLRDAWKHVPQDKRSAILLYSDRLEMDLAQLLMDSNVPMVVTIDTFETIVRFLMLNANQEFTQATQNATYTTTQIGNIGKYKNKMPVFSDVCDRPVDEHAKDLITLFGITCSDKQFLELKARLHGAKGPEATFQDFMVAAYPEWNWQDDVTSTLSRDDQQALRQLAFSYDAVAKDQVVNEIRWPPRCFLDGDLSGNRLTDTKPLSGPARYIFYGPYFCLPVGRWNAEIHIEVQEGRNDAIALVDVFDDDVLSAVTLRFPRHGKYAIDLSFDVARSQKLLQLRMLLLKSSVEGEMLLLGVTLHPAAPEQKKSPAKQQMIARQN